MAKENNYSQYQPIIDHFRKDEFVDAVDRMYKMAGLSTPKTDRNNKNECVKAFLIWLAISAFGASSSADIALGEMALLQGYYSGLGMQERRVKYLTESNYHTKANPDGVENKDLPYTILKKKASQFNKTDTPIFENMIGFFLIKVKDKEAFFEEACEKYLEEPTNGYKVRQAKLPAPSYAIKFEEPIKHIPLLSSPDFVGREDYLSILENELSDERKRCVFILRGMDGIGKTELALQYVNRHFEEYNTIIWLDATSIETLKNDCLGILKTYQPALTLDTIDIEQTALAFCRFIGQRNNPLLIFDNADFFQKNPSEKQYFDYWLRMFIPTENAKAIITTHCDRAFSGAKSLEVDLLDADTATNLLARKADRDSDEYTDILSKRLGYLPLGIEYAGAYIREMGISYKEYLDKWERIGAPLFDQNDSIATVRDVFHITLEKTTDIPFALPFLQFFSELGVNSLPLKDFIDTITKMHFLSMKELDKHPLYESFKDDTGRELLYRIVEKKPDDTVILESPDGERITRKEQKDPLIEYLSSENNRDKLFFALKKYSLAGSNDNMVFVHPLLLEIVFDELHHQSRTEWLRNNSTAGALYEAYTRSGKEQRAKEQLYQLVCLGIKQLEEDVRRIPKAVDSARKNGFKLFNMDSTILEADLITEKAETYGDEALLKRCKELRAELEQILNDASDVIVNTEN